MYLGRYFQGQVVPILVQTRNLAGTPTLSDNPPFIDFHGASGKISQVQMPILDRYVVTGLFLYHLFLNSSFPAGRYRATHFYKTSDYHGVDTDVFEVVAGGDADGSIVTQHYWQRPEATYLIQQTEADSILLRRNPAV